MRWKDILKHEWEIRPCWSGTDCWCRRICTKSGTIIVGGACTKKEVASYFVALHNAKLRNERGYYSRIGNIYSKKFENIIFYDDDNLKYKNQLKRKWRVKKCGVRKCWCRVIMSQVDIWIVSAGSLNKEEAKYFVKLHNQYLKKQRNNWLKSLKENWSEATHESNIKCND